MRLYFYKVSEAPGGKETRPVPMRYGRQDKTNENGFMNDKTMNRIIFCCLFVLCSMASVAQKKVINAARDDVKKGKNLEKAEKTMQTLLQDTANRENEKIWGVLFESLKKQYAQGNEKLYLNQKYDTVALFRIASRTFTAMTAYDSLDVLPDRKGRVRPVFRKSNAEWLNMLRPNLYNGGRFLIYKQQYADAYRLLQQYIGAAGHPMFAAYDYKNKDAQLPQAAYWAVYAAYKQQDGDKLLKYIPLAQKDTAHLAMTWQYLSESYQAAGDTANYLKVLHKGFERYPLTTFFYSRLLEHYSKQKAWGRALALTDKALAMDSTNVMYHLAKSSVLLNQGRYAESYAISDSLLATNDSLAEAHLYAGLAIFNEGVTLEKTVRSAKQKKQVLNRYRQALPHLEYYRRQFPKRKQMWGLPLYTIYLNLNMGKEFDEIDRLMRN